MSVHVYVYTWTEIPNVCHRNLGLTHQQLTCPHEAPKSSTWKALDGVICVFVPLCGVYCSRGLHEAACSLQCGAPPALSHPPVTGRNNISWVSLLSLVASHILKISLLWAPSDSYFLARLCGWQWHIWLLRVDRRELTGCG